MVIYFTALEDFKMNKIKFMIALCSFSAASYAMEEVQPQELSTHDVVSDTTISENSALLSSPEVPKENTSQTRCMQKCYDAYCARIRSHEYCDLAGQICCGCCPLFMVCGFIGCLMLCAKCSH